MFIYVKKQKRTLDPDQYADKDPDLRTQQNAEPDPETPKMPILNIISLACIISDPNVFNWIQILFIRTNQIQIHIPLDADPILYQIPNCFKIWPKNGVQEKT